ncbi:MAG: UDP-2,3-diacylglucosamine diphosphatase, partial [Gammaproteobacteria bacterium]|nr:UDP-2,3-diacylglucosamine diphosphatase [Gammaproteobacteria bacterium]
FLVLHGDQFDSVVCCAGWLSRLGSTAYEWLLELNHVVSFFRRKAGLPYWSLAAYLKHKVKNAVQYISNFEECVAYEAKKRKVDGVVCGHIHRAEIREMEGTLYCNCGDWVESNTALVEHMDGRLELIHWSQEKLVKRELSAVA